MIFGTSSATRVSSNPAGGDVISSSHLLPGPKCEHTQRCTKQWHRGTWCCWNAAKLVKNMSLRQELELELSSVSNTDLLYMHICYLICADMQTFLHRTQWQQNPLRNLDNQTEIALFLSVPISRKIPYHIWVNSDTESSSDFRISCKWVSEIDCLLHRSILGIVPGKSLGITFFFKYRWLVEQDDCHKLHPLDNFNQSYEPYAESTDCI